MDFAQLKYFVTTIDEHNLTRAAEQLHITQPALSRSLANLAAELEVPLFITQGRRLAPTAYGLEFYDWSKKILEALAEVKALMKSRAAAEVPHLRVGISGIQLLATYFSQFQFENPQIQMGTEFFKPDEFYRFAKRPDIDCIVTTEFFPSSTLTYELLFTEPLLAVLPADHPFSDYSELSLDDLKDEEFIFAPKDHLHHRTLERIFRQAGYKPIVKAYVDTLMRLSLIEKGAGITIWPEFFTDTLTSRNNICIIPIKENYCSRDIYLYWDKRVDDNPIFNSFRDFMIEATAPKRK